MTMKGKVVVITGANSGIGFVTAKRLAELGAEIILVCRDRQRGAQALSDIKRCATGAPPWLLQADVSSQAALHTLAGQLHQSLSRIDVLINNAGGIFARRELTVDGIERTLATNYLAPFLLTHLVLDLLRAAPAGRIVNIASALHGANRRVLEDLQGEKHYNFMQAYKVSKFAIIVFTYELARRLMLTGVSVNCVEPGPTRTRFGDNMRGLPSLFPRLMKRLPVFRPPEIGARTPVYAASAPELLGVTGKYLVKCRPAASTASTHDLDLAVRLWIVSAHLTGLDRPAADERAPSAPLSSTPHPQPAS